MNPKTQFDEALVHWLRAEAPASAPAGFHAAVIDRARDLRQRPAWAPLPVRRFSRGRGMTLVAAAVLLGGAALAASSGILQLLPVVPTMPPASAVAAPTAGASRGPTESTAPSAGPIAVAGPGGVWIPSGAMITPRTGHVAVRLLDGRVLVVGGVADTESGPLHLTSAELYDPVTGTWSAAGSVSEPLEGNFVALLHDGRVLVLVGDDGGRPRAAEVYDPARGTWNPTGPLDSSLEASGGTFTMLADGRVLMTGRGKAQIYDPARGTWAATGRMVRGTGSWWGDTSVVLQDGQVLIFGGDGAQVYDPASGTWAATGKKNSRGTGPAAALLSDGKVLVAGGKVYTDIFSSHFLATAEVYDPVSASWTAIADMPVPDDLLAAFPQPDGGALVVGSGSAAVYEPVTDTWSPLPVRTGMEPSAATWLSDGTVLVTDSCTGDLYDPRTRSRTSVSDLPGCNLSSFTLLHDGTVLSAGRRDCNGAGDCVANGMAAVYVPAGVLLPHLPAVPGSPPPVVPTAMPAPTAFPPAAGPVPPNAQRWTVTVENRSSEPATLFVAGFGVNGMTDLVGSAAPSVVPAGATVQVTFLFPADEDAWIFVNPRPGDGGLVSADEIGIPGKIVIMPGGGGGWVSP